jgi:hypothetical protein
MENQIEYGTNRRKVIPEFLQEIRKAEARGIKFPVGTITKKSIYGEHVSSGFVEPTNKLSEAEHKALRKKVFSAYDRDKRTDELREKLRAKLELEEKLRPFHGWVNEKKKDNYIYL